jgi:flagellar biogenesis protein FliO
MRYILANGLFNMDTNERILYFCVSSLGGALLIFVGLIYMVLKGNPDKPQ